MPSRAPAPAPAASSAPPRLSPLCVRTAHTRTSHCQLTWPCRHVCPHVCPSAHHASVEDIRHTTYLRSGRWLLSLFISNSHAVWQIYTYAPFRLSSAVAGVCALCFPFPSERAPASIVEQSAEVATHTRLLCPPPLFNRAPYAWIGASSGFCLELVFWQLLRAFG